MIYAAYQGETPLIVDTVEKVAEFLGVTESTLKWKTTPTGHQKAGKTGVYVIKFKEEMK